MDASYAGRCGLCWTNSTGTTLLIRHVAQVRRAWPVDRPLRTDGWEAYRDALAGRVSDEAWMTTASVYRITRRLNQGFEDIHRHPRLRTGGNADSEPPIPPDTLGGDELRDTFLAIREAVKSLERELGPQAGAFQYTGYASGEETWPEGEAPR
jgi:hypothetical protein